MHCYSVLQKLTIDIACLSSKQHFTCPQGKPKTRKNIESAI